MTDGRGVYLLLSLYIPDADKSLEPDMVADELVAIINEERRRNAGQPEDKRTATDVGIGLFPAVQWLTADVLADLRKLAQRMHDAQEITALSPSSAPTQDGSIWPLCRDMGDMGDQS